MTMHTDGNEVAGLLSELCAAEITTVVRRCHGCGNEHVMAEHLAYRGAGAVLRCPGCGIVAVRIAEFGDELVVQWLGTYRAPRAAEAA
jgi:predicted RNA-binding Zn-ribbon protein involved in translation (DUF1610 family)